MLNKKCFVLDLDGTVYLGDIPIQETVDFILRHWDTIDFHFLSNNTSKAPTTYVNKLTRMGIPATLDRILSPVTPLIAHLRGNGHILDDRKYDYLFTVEDVNRLVLQGVPFREAYRQVGMAVQRGEYSPTREVHHTHEGSIGNLCTAEIRRKMERVMEEFETPGL